MSLWEFAEVPALPVKLHTADTDKKCDMSWRRQEKICDDGFSSECVKKNKLLWNSSVAQLQILEQQLVAGISNVHQVTSLSVNSYAVLV
jgi:hypothetical protein